MRSTTRLVLICGTIVVLVFGALMTELAIRRVDTGPLLSYMISVVIPLVPMLYVTFRQEKTLPAIQDVAIQAAEHAESAAKTAVQVQHNTNGALTDKFNEVKACIKAVSDKVDTHLAEHMKGAMR